MYIDVPWLFLLQPMTEPFAGSLLAVEVHNVASFDILQGAAHSLDAEHQTNCHLPRAWPLVERSLVTK